MPDTPDPRATLELCERHHAELNRTAKAYRDLGDLNERIQRDPRDELAVKVCDEYATAIDQFKYDMTDALPAIIADLRRLVELEAENARLKEEKETIWMDTTANMVKRDLYEFALGKVSEAESDRDAGWQAAEALDKAIGSCTQSIVRCAIAQWRKEGNDADADIGERVLTRIDKALAAYTAARAKRTT